MPLYLFVFDATPTSASPRAQGIGGARITVFVKAVDGNAAEVTARSHVMDYGWQITAEIEARGPVAERWLESDIPIAELLRKAERDGIASEFAAWPKDERPEDSPVEMRPLGPPTRGSWSKH